MERINLMIRKSVILFFISFFLGSAFPVCTLAQEEPAKKIIKFVDVKNNKTVSSAKILSKLKTKRGDVFLEKVADEDVKRLYLMGFFSDVSVSTEEAEDGVGVIFVVTEKAPLSSITFVGNRIYKEKKLNTVIKSKLNEFADEKRLKKDTEDIEDLYKRAGYPWVKVTYTIEPDEKTGQAKAVFTIQEGPPGCCEKDKFHRQYRFQQQAP